AGFASGCRSRNKEAEFSSLATVRPLVRMPTDRHATTGTCEFGQLRNNPRLGFLQELFALRGKKLWQRFFKKFCGRRRTLCTRTQGTRRSPPLDATCRLSLTRRPNPIPKGAP